MVPELAIIIVPASRAFARRLMVPQSSPTRNVKACPHSLKRTTHQSWDAAELSRVIPGYTLNVATLAPRIPGWTGVLYHVIECAYAGGDHAWTIASSDTLIVAPDLSRVRLTVGRLLDGRPVLGGTRRPTASVRTLLTTHRDTSWEGSWTTGRVLALGYVPPVFTRIHEHDYRRAASSQS